MSTWFEDLTKNIDAFFEHASDEKVYSALKKADHDVYKHINTSILAFYESPKILPFYEASLVIRAKDSLPTSKTGGQENWSKISITINQCNNKIAMGELIFSSKLAA